MTRFEHFKESIKEMSLDEKIAEVKSAIFSINMKDHWSNEDSKFETECSAYLQELIKERIAKGEA